MSDPERWKLKVRQIGRWTDIPAFLGWRWQWELREWHRWADGEEGYYAPALFGWHGRARDEDAAIAYVEDAYLRMLNPPKREPEWTVWYRE